MLTPKIGRTSNCAQKSRPYWTCMICIECSWPLPKCENTISHAHVKYTLLGNIQMRNNMLDCKMFTWNVRMPVRMLSMMKNVCFCIDSNAIRLISFEILSSETVATLLGQSEPTYEHQRRFTTSIFIYEYFVFVSECKQWRKLWTVDQQTERNAGGSFLLWVSLTKWHVQQDRVSANKSVAVQILLDKLCCCFWHLDLAVKYLTGSSSESKTSMLCTYNWKLDSTSISPNWAKQIISTLI